MKEISNYTLALLVVTAILVSIFGTFLSLSKLGELGGVPGITGMLSSSTTGTGKANLTVASSAYINLSDDLIELGTIDLLGTNTSDIKNDWWVVRNDGTVNVSIDIYGTQQGGVQGRGPFSTGSTSGGCIDFTPDLCFTVKCKNTTSAGNISTGNFCNNTYYALQTSAGGYTLMNDLDFTDGNDTVWFGVNVTVPPGEPAGNKTQLVTVAATSSS